MLMFPSTEGLNHDARLGPYKRRMQLPRRLLYGTIGQLTPFK